MWYDSPVHIMLDVSVPLIGAPQLWQNGFTGKGVTICIVDTGIDLDHPDFAGRIADTHDFTTEGVRDLHGHGTHCAGIAAGAGTASNGKYRGVAPEATILVAKVLASNGSGATSDVMAGVEWAVQHGAHVISLSLGSDGACDGSDALSQTCDAAMQQGHVVCVAAGNAGPGAGTVGSPGCAHDAITIGATDATDAIASFSSRGPTADGRTKPDICFPGVRITSARAKGTSMGHVVDDNYTSASGTSMATPHASGTCALLRQAHPAATPAQIKTALMHSAKNIGLDANTMGPAWPIYQRRTTCLVQHHHRHHRRRHHRRRRRHHRPPPPPPRHHHRHATAAATTPHRRRRVTGMPAKCNIPTAAMLAAVGRVIICMITGQ